MTVETWLDFANKETKQRLNQARAEIRLCKQNLEEESEFIAHHSEETVRAELEETNQEKEKLLAGQQAKTYLAFLCGKLEQLKQSIEETEAEIEQRDSKLLRLKKISPVSLKRSIKNNPR